MGRGVYKVTIGRPDVDLKEHGAPVSAFMGFNTWASLAGHSRKSGSGADPESKMNPLYESVKDKVLGACSFCSSAFGVNSKVEKAGIELLDDYDRHPSIRTLVNDGYQVMTF